MYVMGTFSTCLKKEGHDVKIIFMQTDLSENYPDESLNELVELSKDADLVGVSVMSIFFNYGVQTTQALKSALNIPVLWGGIDPTVRPEECLAHADMVCLGEGEETLVDLVTKMANEKDYHDIPGLWIKENGRIIKNPIRPLIRNLDTIPLPDNDFENKYLLSDGHIRAMTGRGKKAYKTMPTRGCLFECTYCCNSAFKRLYPDENHIRKRSLDNVLKELMEVKNAESIKFVDDHFFSYTLEEIEAFSIEYRNTINLPLKVLGVSPTTFNKKKLALLVKAGLTHFRIGIQSGSGKTKKLFKRRYSNKHIIHIANIVHEFKLNKVTYDIITDNPWENDEDVIETLMLLSRLPLPYNLGLFSLRLYPGTALYEMAENCGIEPEELTEAHCGNYHIYKKNYLNKLFLLMKKYANKGFVLSPRTMSLLTNQRLRRLRLHWLLYGIMQMKLIILGGFSSGEIKHT